MKLEGPGEKERGRKHILYVFQRRLWIFVDRQTQGKYNVRWRSTKGKGEREVKIIKSWSNIDYNKKALCTKLIVRSNTRLYFGYMYKGKKRAIEKLTKLLCT